MMKRNSILFLFIVLLSSCQDNSPNPLCGSSRAEFYDIQDITVNGLLYEGTDPVYTFSYRKLIPVGQVVTSYNFILELKASTNIRYVKNTKNQLTNLSIISSAQACSPALPITNEIISMLNITSSDDFDATHPAGSNLNELFTVVYTNGNGAKTDFYLNGIKTYNVNEFVAAAPQGMMSIHLKLIQSPSISKTQNFKIEYMQTDSDYYELFLKNITFL